MNEIIVHEDTASHQRFTSLLLNIGTTSVIDSVPLRNEGMYPNIGN